MLRDVFVSGKVRYMLGDDNIRHLVVVNNEEQYSVLPADREIPAGWRRDGMTGTLDECADHIGRIWTDLRPLGLRRQSGGR